MKAILLIPLWLFPLLHLLLLLFLFLARMPRVHWLSAANIHTFYAPTPHNKWLRQQTCLRSVFVFISSNRRCCARKRDRALGRGQGPRPRIRESPPQIPPSKSESAASASSSSSRSSRRRSQWPGGETSSDRLILGPGARFEFGAGCNSQLLYLSHLLLIPGSPDHPQWYRHRTLGIICREKGVQLANAHGHMACSTEASQRFLHSASSSASALETRA